MNAAMPGIAATSVSVMNIDAVQATFRAQRARPRMPIEPITPITAAAIDKPAQAPRTSLDRPSAEGSPKKE